MEKRLGIVPSAMVGVLVGIVLNLLGINLQTLGFFKVIIMGAVVGGIISFLESFFGMCKK